VTPGSISACLVVRNEEAVIERCLSSVAGAVDEIVLVHNGPCTDRTLEIAERFGCRILVRDEADYPEYHRPRAYAEASGEWVLKLDADEYLSDALRAGLRALADDPAVAGYAFRWRLWDGSRYFTRDGPYKLALFRRDAARLIGVVHARERIDGEVREVPLDLEHRPRYANFALATIATKWSAWARVHAQLYLTDLDLLPSWNYPGRLAWSRRRRLVNRLAPVLVVPAALHTLLFIVWNERRHLTFVEAVRMGVAQGLYRGMVTANVARLVYAGGRERAPRGHVAHGQAGPRFAPGRPEHLHVS
jgi:glycosyltransferase involved in cell wall biosynthesis